MPHLLLLEDDADIRLGLEQHLKREGFSLTAFGTGREALRFISQSSSGQASRLDVALLDLTLPDVDGLDVLRAIRADASYRALPVVLVTARNEEIDRVLGLELGADDYISKPYSSRELVARIRAILRRASFIDTGARNQQLAFGPISVDLDMHIARVNGETLELTRREFELLAYFLQNPRRVLSREKILQQVWGLEYLGESRTIDAHVRRVRSKLGDAAALIETVVGVGYRMGSVDA
ncbi:response regulator transcription factor [Mesoterricola silvestris]|uniref:Phosphate regulon transcriptional regulatory protein PhoB n=1 Tax=Mesoterricola silvestris TaxID=2927979 RepID=A0AA48GNX3_9BACT|nr:response regulator transcription factor [Mesoterricola silvestris]BDU73000.1 sensory transduction protein regX3 [Mesoterricola silvestris]